MQSTQKFKNELQFNMELMSLLDIMKGIAASQFRVLEAKKKRFIRFIEAFDDFFRTIDFSSVFHPFIAPKTNKTGIIMLTSNEGFMGGLNAQVINIALAQEGADTAELIIVGERGANYLKELGRNFKAFKGVETTEEMYTLALELRDYITKEARERKFGRLILSYPKPISFMVQRVETLKMLPVPEMFEGKKKTNGKRPLKEQMIIESPLEGIIEYLIEVWWLEKLLEALEESKLSEFAARTIQLEGSHQELDQKEKRLKLQYFRAHHGSIDKSMRESFSAQIIRRRKQ